MKNQRSDKISLLSLFFTILGTIGTCLALFQPEFRKCIGLETGICILTRFKSSEEKSSGMTTEEILNSSWKEIPGTYANSTDTGFKGSAFINEKGFSRRKEFVIFDIIDLHSQYLRIEGDCSKQRWRIIRQGLLESKTQVKFRYLDKNWDNQLNDFSRDILAYACQTNQK